MNYRRFKFYILKRKETKNIGRIHFKNINSRIKTNSQFHFSSVYLI